MIVIIGGGAAGLMAGIAAGRAGAQARVVDGVKKVGAKILVSGGSRCNVTNEHVVPARFNGEGCAPFIARILRSFSPADTHRFFREIGVELKLEATGKFFPTSDTSRTVLAALLQALLDAKVPLYTETPVTKIERNGENAWRVHVGGARPEIMEASCVVLATGGLALPKSGSDGRGYRMARELGHTIVETTPALTPLLGNDETHHALSGRSLPARLTLYREDKPASHQRLASYQGSLLFTHRGYSGPVALNISRHVARERWQYPDAAVFASFFPEVKEEDEGKFWGEWSQKNPKKNVANALSAHMPDDIAETLATNAGVENSPLGRLSREGVAALRAQMFACPLAVVGSRALRKSRNNGGRHRFKRNRARHHDEPIGARFVSVRRNLRRGRLARRLQFPVGVEFGRRRRTRGGQVGQKTRGQGRRIKQSAVCPRQTAL